jgi:hypothetical protein
LTPSAVRHKVVILMEGNMVVNGEIGKLKDEHKGIREQMKFLVKSRKNLIVQDIQVKQRIQNYRCVLYDLRDIIRHYLEFDEYILKSIFGDAFLKPLVAEREEINRFINDLIELSESDVVEKIGQENLDQFYLKIGVAIDKVHALIETYITKEDAILERELIHMPSAKINPN